jgi:TolA-binding protein
MTPAKCRRMEDVLVQREVEADAVLLASMQQHVPSCPACRRHQRTWALVRERALSADDALDDLTRARVFGRVQARLGAQARPEGGPERRSGPKRTRLAWSLGFAAVTILAFVLGTRLRRPEPGLAVAPLALEPYAMHPSAQPGSPVPGKGLDRLELPPHASMRARLGPAADLTLVGPLELIVRDSDKQRVELDLGRGTLLGVFDGSGGRHLRISTPDATVDIVGTRFIVDAVATRTRVAVAHGLVRVESKGRLRMVGAGFSWSTDGDALVPLDGGTARMFEQAAVGQWEEVASEHAPGAAEAETSRGGATKRERSPGRAKGVRAEGPERTAHKRRVHVRRARVPRVVDASGANEREQRASPANVRAADPAVPDRRLALAVPAALPTERGPTPSTSPAPPPAPGEGPPPAVAPSPTAAPPAASSQSIPAPPPVPAPPPPTASRATVSSLYKEAEHALSRGDDAAARQRLVAVVRTFPRDVMADSARFELALLANKAGDQREALAQIREILGRGPGGPFVEPARFLRCRVYLKEDRDAAETCLTRFTRDYPRSPHGDVALRALVELSRGKGQCGKASRLAETYLQRYPKGTFADEAARVRSNCAQ